MKKAYIPDSGDLVWLTFTPQAGKEQAGRRPALVLSPRLYNSASGLALVCPITSKEKGYPFEVALGPGRAVTGVILSDHLKSVDWKTRKAVLIEKAPKEMLDKARMKIAALLGMEVSN